MYYWILYKIFGNMFGYMVAVIFLVLVIAENRYILIEINQGTNSINTTNNSKNGYRQMKIMTDPLPNMINNVNFNGPITNYLSNGIMPNLPSPLHNPHFPQNQYIQHLRKFVNGNYDIENFQEFTYIQIPCS